ncbi:putative reverse transcriptase domain-containing protein [Tanacetum coccineum]
MGETSGLDNKRSIDDTSRKQPESANKQERQKHGRAYAAGNGDRSHTEALNLLCSNMAFKKDCPTLKNNKHRGNQAGKNARLKAKLPGATPVHGHHIELAPSDNEELDGSKLQELTDKRLLKPSPHPGRVRPIYPLPRIDMNYIDQLQGVEVFFNDLDLRSGLSPVEGLEKKTSQDCIQGSIRGTKFHGSRDDWPIEVFTLGPCPRVESIKVWASPKYTNNYSPILGPCRLFIEASSEGFFKASPRQWTKNNQKGVKFDWGDKQEAAFQLLKQKLCSAPILALPEGSEDFIAYCDASKKGLGAVLMQRGKKVVPVVRTQVVNKLHFVEEPVEIMDREVKQLRRSRVPIVKVRMESRRGPGLR